MSRSVVFFVFQFGCSGNGEMHMSQYSPSTFGLFFHEFQKEIVTILADGFGSREVEFAVAAYVSRDYPNGPECECCPAAVTILRIGVV